VENTDTWTFERLIARYHADMAEILTTAGTAVPDGSDRDRVRFVELVTHVLWFAESLPPLGLWPDYAAELNSAVVYLSDALRVADAAPEQAVLLAKANTYLHGIEPSEFEG
jgi:hypothetical protein